MMIFLFIHLLVFIVGGLTLLPSIFLFYWYFYVPQLLRDSSSKDYPKFNNNNNNDITTMNDGYDSKRGWIKLMGVTESPDGTIPKKRPEFENIPGRKKVNSGGNPPSSFTLVFAILRGGTLFCFDDEQQATCHWMFPVRNFTVSLYPTKNKAEAELFGRAMSISLSPKTTPSTIYYISCERPIDKEDWYFALISASHYTLDDNNKLTKASHERDTTLYDPWAMTTLRGLLDTSSAQMDAQCWNAMLGRLFLGIYKTVGWKQYWHTKMKNKLDKINNYNQHPLQQQLVADHGGGGGGFDIGKFSSTGKRSLMRLLPLQLERIMMGESFPCLTQFELMEFTMDGTCMIKAQLDYDGDFLVVLRTGLHTLWRPPTSFMSPFGKNNNNNNNNNNKTKNDTTTSSLPLVLSLKLLRCSGKIIFKIKPPPTCRVWAAFETMPTLEWQVTPVVLDKQIKWSYVTHLLQTKIKELVAETLVMPNMEDFPFYDSGGLGGIFGGDDAGPSKRPTTDGTILNDKDSAIDVDIAKDDKDDENQEPPMVSTLVEGYMDRIRNPHKYPPIGLDTTTTTNL